MKYSRLLLLIILIINSLSIYGQAKGKMEGRVIDAVTKQPIDEASITLLHLQGNKPVDGSVTDTNGHFKLTGIVPGTYSIKIEFVGYRPYTRNNIVIGAGSVSLGSISLMSATTILKDVTINGTRPLVENRIDKIVYNAANDLTSQNGVALDVLKKVPLVSVDIDGNVELEGDANIRFLINGKPSTMFGSSLSDALQAIPASQIKSIEVITSPGAKYDASGTGGIINIVLKDSRVQGIHGTLNVSAGTRLENGSFNLNVRRGNFGVNAFFSGNEQHNTTTLNIINRQTLSGDTATNLTQTGQSSIRRSGYESGISAEWDITSKDKLTAAFDLDHFGNHTQSLTQQLQQVTDTLGNALSNTPSTLHAGSQFRANTGDWSLDYKKNFTKEDQELDVNISHSTGNDLANYFQEQDFQGGNIAASGSRGNNPGKDRETDISTDYTQPFSKGITVETGVKGVFENLDNNVATDTLLGDKTYSPNANQSYSFSYSRQVYAYYVSTNFSAFHHFIDVQAGLRYEYTHTTANFPGASIPDYGLWAPSVILSHKLDETQSIKAAYNFRIERPDYGDLNPFYNISDPHNISTGNPGLKPERGRRYELGYNKTFDKGGNLYIAAVYRYTSDDIQPFSTYYASLEVNGTSYSDVFLTQRFNLGTQSSIGGNLFGSVPVTSALTLRTNVQFGERSNKNPGLPTTNGFVVRGNLNATYTFRNDFAAEVFGNYNSSQRTIQGTRPAFGFYTLAMRKGFLHKKASLGLTATNPFTRYVDQRSTLYGTGFTQNALRQIPYQSFGLTLSYKFGKLEFKEKDKDKEHDTDQAEAPKDQP